MEPFEAAVEETLRIEGRFVDDPDDSGGATNWGITERLAREYGFQGDMRAMTREEAIAIYRAAFWLRMRLDEVCAARPSDLPPSGLAYRLARRLFDFGVNCGRGLAGNALQAGLNVLNNRATLYGDVAIDGDIGPKTLAALYSLVAIRGADGLRVLTEMVRACQGVHYMDLALSREKDEKFVFGWFLQRLVRFPDTQFQEA